jgi:cytochrome b
VEQIRGPIAIWDLPVRIVHWGFVVLIPALWWTGEEGHLDQHKLIGYAMLALVAFRILWGLIGSTTARFGNFIKGPSRLLGYLRGMSSDTEASFIGHNPLGALSVVALLLLLAAQVSAGLIAQDVDGIESGPLSYLVSYDTADAAREWHNFLFDVLLALIAVHVAAVLFYLVVRRNNLIGPMITGRKAFSSDVAPPGMASAWRMASGAIVSVALAWWISAGAPLP